MAVLRGMPRIQISAGSARLYIIGGSLGLPEFQRKRHLDRFSRFSGLTGWQTRPTDRPTDHGIYVRSTVMWSNNNCSISRLLCFYRRTEQGNRRQQTSLRPQCGIARWTIGLYFLKLSSVNAKLTSLSYAHASPQTNRHVTQDRNKRAKNGDLHISSTKTN